MNKTTVYLDPKIVEFMLDLPTDCSIFDLKMENNKILIILESETIFPPAAELVYEYDEYGNVALTGLTEVKSDN